jgi:hypothetical protein
MDMFNSLLAQPQSSGVHPETLEMLGRQAAQLYQQQGIPLNQAINQILSSHPEINNEHINRIVEFANNVTFQELFEKSPDKNIHFPVADPGVVIRDLKDGGSPAHDGKPMRSGDGDYLSSPKQSENSELESLFSNQFTAGTNGGEQQVKMASVEAGLHMDPLDDLYDTQIRLESARAKLAEAHEQFDLAYKDANEDLWNSVKREVLDPDGAGLGGVVGALKQVASDEEIAPVLTPMVEKLANSGISGRSLSLSLEKKAGAFINTDHPMMMAWFGMQKAAYEMKKSALALKEVDSSLSKVAGALTTAIKESVGAKSPIPGGIRQRFPRK